MVPQLGFVDPIAIHYIYLNDDETSSVVGKYITYLLELKIYLIFTAAMTSGQGYTMLSSVISNTSNYASGCTGRFGANSVVALRRVDSNSIEIIDRNNTRVFLFTNGSSTLLGDTCQIDMIIAQ